MATNTHGYKMVGIKKIAGKTKRLTGQCSGDYYQLRYNKRTGELFVNERTGELFVNERHHSGQSSQCGGDILIIGNLCRPYTMQDLADMVAAAADHDEERRAFIDVELLIDAEWRAEEAALQAVNV